MMERASTESRGRLRTRAGFTLIEIMIAVLILGIMSTMALTNYTKSVETSRRQAAKDVLQTIYAGEQTYWSLNNTYVNNPTVTADWNSVFVDNPNLPAGGPVTYTVTAAGTGSGATFTATATYASSPTNKTLTIDQTRNLDETGWLQP